MLHKHEIGVCVDGNVAYLLEDKNDEHLITILHADAVVSDDKSLRAKRKIWKLAFYRKVFEMIRDFDKISLCGTAAAKEEIKKLFKTNSLKQVLIEDDMAAETSESQAIDFINRYFKSKNKNE